MGPWALEAFLKGQRFVNVVIVKVVCPFVQYLAIHMSFVTFSSPSESAKCALFSFILDAK